MVVLRLQTWRPGVDPEAPNLIDWTLSQRHLASRAGEKDPGSVVRMWNSQCPVSQQIVGRKAMALKSLMEQMPEECLVLLTTTVSELGWEESPWTDDALASKRIVPGYTFRVADSKVLSARQTVSKQFAVLMVDRVGRGSARKNIRGNMTEKQVAERAQYAAVIHNVLAEVKKIAPISQKDLDELLRSWLGGDVGVDMELRSAVVAHDENFHPKDLPSLRDLLEKYVGPRPWGQRAPRRCGCRRQSWRRAYLPSCRSKWPMTQIPSCATSAASAVWRRQPTTRNLSGRCRRTS